MERTLKLTVEEIAVIDQSLQQLVKLADIRSVKVICELHTKISAQLDEQNKAAGIQ